MNGIIDHILKLKQFTLLKEDLKKTGAPAEITGVCDALRPFLCASFFYETKKRLFITVPDEKEANSIKEKLCALGIKAMVFPARDFLFDNVKSYSKEWEQQRIAVIFSLLKKECECVITVPDGAMQYTLPKSIAEKMIVDLKIGDRIEPKELIKKLSGMGYKRAETVEGAGQFASRGSIIDVFSPQYERPCRLDFFDDELDSMGCFDVLSQRRSENMQSVSILPVTELLLSDEAKSRIDGAISELISAAKDSATAEVLKAERISVTELNAGPLDKYYSLIYDEKSTVFDYAGDFISVVIDSKRIVDRARAYGWENDEMITAMAEKGLASFKNASPLIKQGDLIYKLGKNCIGIGVFSDKNGAFGFASSKDIDSKRLPPLGDDPVDICERVSELLKEGKTVLTSVSSERAYSALSEILEEHGVKTYKYKDKVYDGAAGIIADPSVSSCGSFEFGGTVFLSETESGALQTKKKKKAEQYEGKYKSEKIASYADLSVGDLVVHVNHGIGRYVGIDQLKFEGATRDYIKLEYRGGDNLYVPCDQLDRISKYVGAENVKLTGLGTSEWQKAKVKAKAAATDIAKGLIKLYSERRLHHAFAFPPDDGYQKEFEDAFGFAETPGQLYASEEIKKDMESDVPMDRLLCGDVGFGKTEVALRAVFKCVCAGKQAAILVPTTILAWQHYQTMLQRFRTFPVNVQMLSRFRDKTAQEAILKDLKTGKTDVIVGTHKLLQKYIEFKDLGLLVIDEEQRFGVTHKEKLKEMSKNVHVLTLSATPIPRTLNMALTGIRDLSVLEEAPEGRLPVQSFVIEHDDVLINEAIRRELRRGGQVFYLHNFVESIYKRADMLRKEFPDRVIAAAHGQMSRDELSSVWEAMVKKEIDILVCTTIIETGIDVPNANTLIIEDANKLGLSQLHQIRGRVGRSSRKAYAYFTYREETLLSSVAIKRLEAIKEYSEFGSGFKIAMRDLELRGAGNLLGAEQHGHMDAIGYDLYVKLLEESVKEQKGVFVPEKEDCRVSIPVDAYIPESYVPSMQIRIDMYRKISNVSTNAEKDDIEDELTDRFGDLPACVCSLISVSFIRNTASSLDITGIEQNERLITFYPKRYDKEKIIKLALCDELKGRIMISPGAKPNFSYKLTSGEDKLKAVNKVLNMYAKI